MNFIVINSFISSISKEKKRASVEFQVFCFTNKIQKLTLHLELHKKDFLSQRGMCKILGKCQRMLPYLSKINKNQYIIINEKETKRRK
ncbi:hypothetical protein AMTRI_Chr08g168830 [Amborella trichopoda]